MMDPAMFHEQLGLRKVVLSKIAKNLRAVIDVLYMIRPVKTVEQRNARKKTQTGKRPFVLNGIGLKQPFLKRGNKGVKHYG